MVLVFFFKCHFFKIDLSLSQIIFLNDTEIFHIAVFRVTLFLNHTVKFVFFKILN